MNKLLILIIIFFLTSCNAKTDVATENQESVIAEEPEPKVDLLYPSAYPSDWKIGDPKYILKVQELYRIMMSDSNYDAMLPYLADSVDNVRFDNSKVKLSAPDFVKAVKDFRKNYKTLNEDFRNYVALRSESQDIDMVMLWLKERGVRKNGKADSSGYQETWRFNKEGKIDYRSTYVRYDF